MESYPSEPLRQTVVVAYNQINFRFTETLTYITDPEFMLLQKQTIHQDKLDNIKFGNRNSW